MSDIVRHFDTLPDLPQSLALLQRIAAAPQNVTPRRVDKPLYLYGAGDLGKLAWDYLKVLGIPVAGVMDGNPARYADDPFWAGITLSAPADIPAAARQDSLLAICVGTFPFGEVTKPLAAAGWRDIVPFYTLSAGYTDRHPLNNGWFTGPLSDRDLAGIADVLGRYADDQSRAFHLQFTAWHALQEEWIFQGADIGVNNRYFIPDVVERLGEHEIFVDLGAHTGKVLPKFLALVDSKFDEIVAVEPDPLNAAQLRTHIAELPAETAARCRVVEVALAAQPGTARFFGGIDYASRICEYGTDVIEVRTLDSLDLRPTFLKVHLEGEEMAALLGGLETIKRHRPIIAATLYHNRLGLWEAQQRLMNELTDLGYEFRFRLHGWHGTGSVLYMLPKT